MMIIFRALALTVVLLVMGALASYADTPGAPPAGMTQEQYDALVDAISSSVAQKLKAESGPATTKPKSSKEPQAAAAEATKPVAKGPGAVALFLQRAGKVMLAIPELGRRLTAIGGGLDEESVGGWGIAGFVLTLVLIGTIAVTAGGALRPLLGKLRARLARGGRAGRRPPPPPPRP